MEGETFNVEITLGNDAMQTSDDVADALSKVVARLRGGEVSGSIRDLNGNTVGSFGFAEE